METVTYFEFKTFGYSDKIKRFKVNYNDLICLFTIDNAQAVDLTTMKIVSYR